jgi:peptidoglycan/xylan/chitin deacetylase (PgdA/CDA1 family)
VKGAFVISLDFELFWGVRDSKSLRAYGNHILGVREAMPKLLALFNEFHIKATFAAVGLLHFDSKETLVKSLPNKLPQYLTNKYTLTPEYIESIGSNETDDPLHFGASLIKQIQATHIHEIATHTFSHYYTLEEGADTETFRLDLQAANKIALNSNIPFNTIIFPRNQYNSAFLEVCKQEGLRGFRGTENSWIYKPLSRSKETKWRRLVRFLDAYINISGYNTHKWSKLTHKSGLYNIPASRYLRPYSHSLRVFESLRLKRILNAMTHAAINEQIFHLWWHPHNFGKDVETNLTFLRSILEHQQMLYNVYGFESHTMNKCYSLINNHEQ